MKVLHITYTDAGGAGIAAMRIHKSLCKHGIESSMLVADKTSHEESVYTAENCFTPSYIPPKNKILRKIKKMARKRGYFLSTQERYDRLVDHIPSAHKTLFTSPLSCYNLNQHPAVLDADIIHLHWVANFIDYPTFFPNINKPIVWTLHDENLAFGGFHYGREREQYYPYYAEVEDDYCQIKQSSLAQCKDIHMVALSKMMKDFYTTKSFLSGRHTIIIHNGIDTDIFKPLDRSIGRQVYHIPENNYVIAFCCVNLNDKRKGLAELVEAISKLQRYEPLEAIACGLPIVAFPCSGMEELVNSDNGVVCKDFTTESLVEGLTEVTNKEYDKHILHSGIEQRFTSDIIANNYIDLYNRILHT